MQPNRDKIASELLFAFPPISLNYAYIRSLSCVSMCSFGEIENWTSVVLCFVTGATVVLLATLMKGVNETGCAI